MKKIFLALVLLTACESSSSSPLSKPLDTDTPIPSTVPSATASAAPSASAAPTPKGNAPAPSAMPFCKAANFTSDPMLAICAVGQDWSKAHFDCAKPLPVNFCADESVWGCQYIAPAKSPKVTYEARFVRPGVALNQGEIINDDGLRSRFPRAGTVRGVTLHTTVTSTDEGLKMVAAQTKKFTDAGCVSIDAAKPSAALLDCGGWQAYVHYADLDHVLSVDADMPSKPDCTK